MCADSGQVIDCGASRIIDSFLMGETAISRALQFDVNLKRLYIVRTASFVLARGIPVSPGSMDYTRAEAQDATAFLAEQTLIRFGFPQRCESRLQNCGQFAWLPPLWRDV